MSTFKEIAINELSINPFTLIGKEWMLITAGDEHNYNNHDGLLGRRGFFSGTSRSLTFSSVRSATLKEFVDAKTHYSLCFFDETRRDMLNFCGTKSGRDVRQGGGNGHHPGLFGMRAPIFRKQSSSCSAKALSPADDGGVLPRQGSSCRALPGERPAYNVCR